MAKSKSMSMDFTDFNKGFKELVEKSAPPEIAKGMFRALNELLRDAEKEEPMAPFDKGDLRGSARVQTPDGSLHELGGVMTTAGIKVPKGDSIEMAAGFNIVYAAVWHELPKAKEKDINWTTPGSGRKYLETKMVRYKEKYVEIIALFLSKLLR
jgi:hypothetical protein